MSDETSIDGAPAGDAVAIPIDFSCKVCGCQCSVAPDPPERAVCEEHCPDHIYEYDPWRRDRFCKTCDKQVDPDWHDSD